MPLSGSQEKVRAILRPLLAVFHGFEPQISVPLAAYTALAKLREELCEEPSMFPRGKTRLGTKTH